MANEHRYKKGKTKKSAKKPVILIITIIVLIAIAAIFIVNNLAVEKDKSNKPTEFVEHELETFKKNGFVEIDDPMLGHISIEVAAGATKNTYDLNSIVTDENNIKSYYHNGEIASTTGVDLSSYQGDVDFEQLKALGIDFAILRIGGRAYGDEGKIYFDDNFDSYYEQAKSAGLKVGAYFFSQAINIEEAKEEADAVIYALGGKKLDYPVAFDWEYIEDDFARTEYVNNELTDIAVAFCNEIEKNNLVPIIYSNTYLMYYVYDMTRLKDYDFWVADYGDYPTMYYGFTMWQYSTDTILPGMDSPIDLNLCFKNY